MNLAKIALTVLVVHCQIQSALATNLWFMPGDACFPAVLDKNLAGKMRESKGNMHVEFSSLSSGGYFCGYAGYQSIDIHDVPDAWSENIHEIYTALRARSPRIVRQEFDEDGKLEAETETNGFLMFVQNGNFDLDKFQVGFRYNEDWMNAFPGAKGQSLLYQPYFTRASDMIEDWGNSKQVAPLKVQVPEPDKEGRTEFERRFGKAPLTGSAKELMVVILPRENLTSHLLNQSDPNSTPTVATRKANNPVIVLNATGAWLFRRDKERIYRAIPWKRTLKIDDSHQEFLK